MSAFRLRAWSLRLCDGWFVDLWLDWSRWTVGLTVSAGPEIALLAPVVGVALLRERLDPEADADALMDGENPYTTRIQPRKE